MPGMAGTWWQLSFADPTRPTGQQWLGGINVEAPTIQEAITFTHRAGINPGGQIQFLGFTAESMDPHYVGRLITDRQEWTRQPLPVNAKAIRLPYPPFPQLNGTKVRLSSEPPTAEPRQGDH